MEKFSPAEEKQSDIPDREQVDFATSPVSKEELAAELLLMKEAASSENDAEDREAIEGREREDASRIKDVKASLNEMAAKRTPEERKATEENVINIMREELSREQHETGPEPAPREQMKQVPPEAPPTHGDGGDDEDPGYVKMSIGKADIQRETCPACGGSGIKWFIFPCWRCHGYGSIGINKGMHWEDKLIKRKKKNEGGEIPPENEESSTSEETRHDAA
jgi:hypothetical protein